MKSLKSADMKCNCVHCGCLFFQCVSWILAKLILTVRAIHRTMGCTPEIVYQLLLTWKQNSIEPSVSTVTYALENADLKKLLKTLKP